MAQSRRGWARARWGRLALLTGLLGSLMGCAAPTPWVKPYEREHFADPIMSFNRNPVSSVYLEHVLESREGARGATGNVGGGCGCN
ncbi:MAG: DUF4266 domain-containing protein [Gammaproteobacteria bacterium]|nr:DUF4266 domain-containing protein [Gammaproteobacteria bacterium]MBV9620305.1 DUF4266 domain-containing protein [Gammaproteobacteria bacterium]